MKIIKLTSVELNRSIFLNVNTIDAFFDKDGNSPNTKVTVVLSGNKNNHTVKETPEEIVKLIEGK